MKVIKRDGSEENFDISKIVNVVKAAGLDDESTEKFIANVEEWINSLDKKSVKSTEIRDKVIALLPNYNKYAKGLYEWYEKMKYK